MIKTFSKDSRSIIVVTILTCFATFCTHAQTSPKLKFIQPHLVAGINGKKDAMYKFSNVIPGVDELVKIENIVNAATLVNIDDSTLGYYNAWQPTVGGPGTYGSSYIKWQIEFKISSGSIYKFPVMDASSIDVDGDNVRIREFVDMNGQSSYAIPNQIPSLLKVTMVSDPDNFYGDDPNPTNLHALGPVINRAGIDTFSQDVRIDYHFINKSKIKIYTGSQVDNNGSTGAISTPRYHCIYFMKIGASFTLLPATYHSFGAIRYDNKVSLSWINEDIKSNDHFEIERSYDQKEFNTIGIVVGSQTIHNSIRGQYNFTDAHPGIPEHKEVFYRLKYMDMNGNFSYSMIKRVSLNTSKMNVLVMPNPFMEKLNANFVSDNNGTAEIRLLNTWGSVVRTMQCTIAPGYNNLQMQDLGSLAPGLYIIDIAVNGNVIGSQKLIKQ